MTTVEPIIKYTGLPTDIHVEIEVRYEDGHYHVEGWDKDDSLGYFDLSEQEARDAIKHFNPKFDRPLYREGWFSVSGRNNNKGIWTTNPKLEVQDV